MSDWRQQKYATLEEYLNEDYAATMFKRGRWRVLDKSVKEDHYQLWHQCEKDTWELGLAGYYAWSELADRAVIPKWRCGECWATPPESVVAVYCLMEPDATSHEVQEELRQAERNQKFKDDPYYMDHSLDEELGLWSGWGYPQYIQEPE